MRPRLFSWLGRLAAGALVVGASAQVAPGTVTLASLRDRARPLLVFASRRDDPQLEIQLRALEEHAPEARERDLIVVALPFHAPSPTQVQFSAAEAHSVRRRFNVPPDRFLVLLIGKDGDEKLRSAKPLSITRLAETIDAMPMRQDEIRHAGR